jgi:uncharacterized protein YggE
VKTENFLFIISVIAIVGMTLVLALSVLYPNGSFQNQGLKFVTVTASGTNYTYPAAATVYVTMNGTGTTSAIAASNLSLTLSEFNYTVAKYIGNNSSRISTQSYSLQRQWNSTKYEAVETVSVYVAQVGNVTPLLNTLSLIQNVYVSQVSAQLTPSQVRQLSNDALAQAMSNATSQARVISQNMSLTLRNVSISKSYTYPFPLYANGVASSGSGPNLIFFNGVQGVRQQVTVSYTYT